MLADVSKILHAPGNLLVDPQWSGALDPADFPWGGTVLGNIQGLSMIPFHDGFTVWAEEWGSAHDQLEPHADWGVGAFFRGWDDDAIEQLFANPTTGAVSSRAGFDIPGTVVPGTPVSERKRVLVFSPLNPKDVPGAVFYSALPILDAGGVLAFQHAEELGLPIMFRLIRDDQGNIGVIRWLWDITL